MARREKPMNGLRVDVKNNNIEFALKKFKRIVKDSNLMLELKEKQYYKKKSSIRREKINKVKSRAKYQKLKDINQNNF